MTTTLHARQTLLEEGWAHNVAIELTDGVITAITDAPDKAVFDVDILLPSPTNLHSHAFQRAMAGMTEVRGPKAGDDFWGWRELMYKFMTRIKPDDMQAIASFVQMEMLEAGYAACAEFHYLHHNADGRPYDNLAEMGERITAAADLTGIGLTLLPVLYERGGCEGQPLGALQARFGNDLERYWRLFEGSRAAINRLPSDARLGIAPHSLRAVKADSLTELRQTFKTGPIHIHAAEQDKEVAEVIAAYGKRPVRYLLDEHGVDNRWCLIHATQMDEGETVDLARSQVVAGICPMTEANLGDGIFDGVAYLQAGGRFGIGSDSNVRISLSEELRLLEYSQRLRDKVRVRLAAADKSTGRVLLEESARGGAQAAGRNSGVIAVGKLADFIALDAAHVDLLGKSGNAILDSYIFAGDDRMVTDTWSAGRHVVQNGQHKDRAAITQQFSKTMARLRADI